MPLTKVSYSMIDGAPVNVKDFGAVGDGVTDDHDAIQAAADYVVQNKKKLIFPTGTYLINKYIYFGVFSGGQWQPCGDFAVEGYGAEIKAGPTIPYTYEGGLFAFERANNFSLRGLKFNGMCINPPSGIIPAQIPVHDVLIYSCSNFIVADIVSVESKGDGIYVDERSYAGHSHSYQITNCNISEASRNGISIVSGIDFVVSNNIVTNTGRNTAIPMPGGPFAGIDIEEDPGGDLVENGIVSNNVFKNNLGNGAMNWNADNIIFDGNICIDNDNNGIEVGLLAGATTISNNQIVNTTKAGVYVANGASHVLIDANKIYASGACGIFLDSVSDAVVTNNQVRGSLGTESLPTTYIADIDAANSSIISDNYVFYSGVTNAIHVSNAGMCCNNHILNNSTTGGGIIADACQFITGNLVYTNSAKTVQGSIFLANSTDPDKYKVVNDNFDNYATSSSVANSRRILEGSAAPVSGAWRQGDIVYNNNPTAGGTIGWICVAAGTPGTWKTFGTIAS